MALGMSGVADSPIGHQPLRFGEYLERINRGEQVQRAAERRNAAAADGGECRQTRHAPAARQADAPRLAEVNPAPTPYPPMPSQRATVTIQQLLPIGSIIDMTI